MESEHMHPNKPHLLRSLSTFGLVLAVAADQALAALPAPVAPSTAPAASDWLGLIKGYIKDGGIIIGLFLAVAGFLWLGWMALADLNQVRNGRKEWGEIGLSNVAGAAVFLFVSYLLGQAANVI
jgi:integrating conjugative element membrane protein (TIGR03745 family)